ncbi:MAG: DinB family protein [Tunicatimonas sp.]
MTSNLTQPLHRALIDEVKRRIIGESVPRIKQCLGQLSTDEIWHRPNENVVSVGNLVLHLQGNLRQWVLSGLGGQPDHRQRDDEFEHTDPLPAAELLQPLDTLMAEVETVLDRLTPADLLATYRVQGYRETGVAILMHVTEHFSYHTGQITYFVKTRKDVDLHYYGGQDLNQTA